MDFGYQQFGELCVGTPRGRIDQSSAGSFQQALTGALRDSRPAALVLDLSAVDYISSAGLRVVMMAARELRERSARIAVASLQPMVREIFEISRFHHVVGIHVDARDAVRAIAPGSLGAFDASSAAGRT